MAKAVEGIRWTIHDLEVLPQSEGTCYEIIAGELFMTRAPHYRHQQVCFQIARQLNDWSEKSGLGVAIITPGVIFSEADSVIPDVVWVSYDRLAQIADEAGHLTDAPELVVEVLSPGVQNQRRDREAKLKLYSIQGVREYWLCDRDIPKLEVYRRQNAQLQLTATLYPDDEITSPLLPGFAGAVRSLFPSLQ